jgi:pimeloyl-ACP methyl ester carboxylesterase
MMKPSRVVAGLSVAGATLLPLLVSGCASADEPQPQQEQEQVGTNAAELGIAPTCDKLTFQVALSAGQPANYHVVGWLCGRGSIDHRVLQVLVHGITYSHNYWDFPYKPEQYSYVNYLTAAGYATLNLDRIGIGESDHPPALDVTVTSNAYVIHQIIQQFRAGSVTTPSFGRVKSKRVMTVGHSLGSAISMLEAATYHDVDGMIVTDLLHNFGPDAYIVPFTLASYDPHFAGRNIPDGYLTTVAGARGGEWFYYAPATDPNVVAVDEATKETGTFGEGSDVALAQASTPAIDVPVMTVVGNFDKLACNDPSCTESGTLANEYQYWSPAAHLEAVAIPYAGHDINLHKQAPAWFALAAAWSLTHVGVDTRLPKPQF